MAANFWASTHFRRWLLTKEEVTRRRRTGLREPGDEEMEKIMRPHLVVYAQALGKRLHLLSRVTATAVVFISRFYLSTRMRDADPRIIVPAAVYLAAKVEEMGHYKPQIVIDQAHRVTQSPELASMAIKIEPTTLLANELLILEQLSFELVIFHPHHDVDKYGNDAASPELASVAGTILNDSLRSDVGLVYPPFIIALAAIYLAGIHCKVDLKPWFDHLNVNVAQVRQCVSDILEVYTNEASFKAQLPQACKVLLQQ